MKAILPTIILITYSTLTLYSQSISEENYLIEDKLIWETYEKESSKVFELIKQHPNKKDSLMQVLEELYELANVQNCETAIKYASVPSGLKRLYMVRLDISKDTLQTIILSLPSEMQNSKYAQSITQHINSNQIEVGSQYEDLPFIDSEGEKFKLSMLNNKKILLLYNGLDCMGKSDRERLQSLYNEKKFEVVVYWSCSSQKELQNLESKFSVDYKFISDFKGDHSLFKIIYGAQARPTSFLINENGEVVLKTLGLPENEQLNKFL